MQTLDVIRTVMDSTPAPSIRDEDTPPVVDYPGPRFALTQDDDGQGRILHNVFVRTSDDPRGSEVYRLLTTCRTSVGAERVMRDECAARGFRMTDHDISDPQPAYAITFDRPDQATNWPVLHPDECYILGSEPLQIEQASKNLRDYFSRRLIAIAPSYESALTAISNRRARALRMAELAQISEKYRHFAFALPREAWNLRDPHLLTADVPMPPSRLRKHVRTVQRVWHDL